MTEQIGPGVAGEATDHQDAVDLVSVDLLGDLSALQSFRRQFPDEVSHRVDHLLRLRDLQDETGGFTAFTKAFRLFLQSAMLGVGAFYALAGEVSAGAMVAASILLGRALAPVEQSLGQWPVLRRALSGWRALGQFLAEVPADPARTELPVPKARRTSPSVLPVRPVAPPLPTA